MRMATTRKAMSIRLSDEAVEMLSALAASTKASKTAIIEAGIELQAKGSKEPTNAQLLAMLKARLK
jgi:predicted transcriptional regulator